MKPYIRIRISRIISTSALVLIPLLSRWITRDWKSVAEENGLTDYKEIAFGIDPRMILPILLGIIAFIILLFNTKDKKEKRGQLLSIVYALLAIVLSCIPWWIIV